jgi:peroxiredoxin
MTTLLRNLWKLVLVAGLFLPGAAGAAVGAREIPNFNLLDLRGRDHELYRAEGKVLVLFFTGVGCPIARKNAAKLEELRERFGEAGVGIWIVNSYPGDSTADARKEAGELGLHGFVYLRDAQQRLAVSLGIERTAEVVAIGLKDRRVFYRGAIDDQYAEGAERPAARQHYLVDALTEHLAGKPVTLARTAARGCRLNFATFGGASGDGVPTYDRDVAPLLLKACVPCHRDGAIGPWSMDGHARVMNHAAMIEEVLLTRRMPPWDPDPDFGKFTNPQDLTREESQAILRWVRAGSPRGGAKDPLSEPLPAMADWSLGKPGVVLRLPAPEQVPATGVLEYRHIRLPNPFTNEVWISGTDIKPGNRKVVHHAILYAKWPGSGDDGSGNGVHFCGWAPGSPPSSYPVGVAKRLPAGAELTLEMHYTTCGSPQTDQTEVALYLAEGPQTREVTVRRAEDYDVNIPPGSEEARHTATYAFRKPAILYSMSPHMHVRGKWMRYELLLPNGRRETLLNVPRYDFNWQLGYNLAEPRRIPAGAWLLVTGAFDNSPGRPGNPDPTRRVHFGLQSWDEMFIGFFEAATDVASEAASVVDRR